MKIGTSGSAPAVAGGIQYDRCGRGPAVLWLHGMPGGCDQAMLVSARLAAEGFTVVCPSRPGYLGTALRVGRTPAEQAAAMVSLLEHIEVESCAVVATSGGGPVALHLASRYPDRVTCLVMVSAVSAPYTLPGSALARRVLLSSLGVWLFSRLYDRRPATAVRALLKQQSNFSPAELRRAVATVQHDPDKLRLAQGLIATMRPFRPRKPGLRNDIRQLRLLDPPPTDLRRPLLVVHGAADRQVPVDQARRLAAAVPGAQLFVVPEAAHLLPLSPHSAEVDLRIATFLRRHSPDR